MKMDCLKKIMRWFKTKQDQRRRVDQRIALQMLEIAESDIPEDQKQMIYHMMLR